MVAEETARFLGPYARDVFDREISELRRRRDAYEEELAYVQAKLDMLRSECVDGCEDDPLA